MNKAIRKNFLISKYTNKTLKPTIDNNFKILIPQVNMLVNSGQKIIFILYELAGIIILRISGIVIYLIF